MAQLLEFVVDHERPRDWHLYFLREVLTHVAEAPTERQYLKWLRERKVFDRKLLAFCERLAGIERAPLQAPALGEVAREHLAAIEKAKKKAEEDSEKARQALAKKPGRDMPRPKAVSPDDELDEEKAFAEKPLEAVAQDDPFVKGVLERAVELNSYLSKFVLRELGDDFLAVGEIYRRISTSAYVGKRPALPQFESWVKWLEWLGGLQKVGFRHKATQAGRDHGKALKDVPDSELLAPSREDELSIEAPQAVPVAVEAPGRELVANAPTGRRSVEVTDEGDEETASDEGLELPPAAAVPPEPDGSYWPERKHDDDAPARSPLPDPVIAPKPFSEVMRELTDVASTIATNPRPEVPPPAPPRGAGGGQGGGPPATQGPNPPVSTRPASVVLSWWRDAGRPGERLGARAAGLDLSIYRGATRGLLVYKLCALASFLEVSPRAQGLAFFRDLATRGAFEALFHEEAPLERVIDLDPARPLPHARELVGLLRARKPLKKDAVLAKLDGASSGRDLARTLHREVTGDSLSTGVLLVVREMAQAGHWRPQGIDALGCVPWAEAREAAWRLGLLASPSVSTFEEALAASEALSANFSAQDENETALLAFASRVAFPDRGALP